MRENMKAMGVGVAIGVTAFLLGIGLGSCAASAQAYDDTTITFKAGCSAPAVMLDTLVNKYDQPVVDARMGNDGAMYLTTESVTGSWTKLVILPDGKTACIYAAGGKMIPGEES